MSLLSLLGKTTKDNHTPETAVLASAAVKHSSTQYPNSGIGRLFKPMVIAGTLAMATFGVATEAQAHTTSETINSARRIYGIFDNDRTVNRVGYEIERNVRMEEREAAREAAAARRAEAAAQREQARAIRAQERAQANAVRDEINAREKAVRQVERLQKLDKKEIELGMR